MVHIPDDIMTPDTQNAGAQKSVVILTGDKVEDLEFYYPYYRFIEEGYRVDVATPEGGTFKGKTGYKFEKALRLSDLNPDNYDLLYIPGGKAPASLMKKEDVLAFVRSFAQSGRPIASICHGPQILAAANVIRGESISAYPEVRFELEAAGATFIANECEVSGQFITARWPADLPMHLKRTLEILDQAPHLAGSQAATRRDAWMPV